MSKSRKGETPAESFRSEATQEMILEHLRDSNGPETIREIAEAIRIEPSAVAANLGEMMSKAEQGLPGGVRRVMGAGDVTRYEIAPRK